MTTGSIKKLPVISLSISFLELFPPTMILAIPSNTRHIPSDMTIGGNFRKMNTKELRNPNTIPINIVSNKKATILLMVEISPPNISLANKAANIPVAPSEKSIRPELRLELSARAATIVKVTLLTNSMMFFSVEALSPGFTNKVSWAIEDNITAINPNIIGKAREKNKFLPNFLKGLEEVIMLRLNFAFSV